MNERERECYIKKKVEECRCVGVRTFLGRKSCGFFIESTRMSAVSAKPFFFSLNGRKVR